MFKKRISSKLMATITIPGCDDSPEFLHALYEVNLLLGQHPGEYLAPLHDPVQEGFVVISDQAERLAVAREHVVLLLNGLDEVGLQIIKSTNIIHAFFFPSGKVKRTGKCRFLARNKIYDIFVFRFSFRVIEARRIIHLNRHNF